MNKFLSSLFVSILGLPLISTASTVAISDFAGTGPTFVEQPVTTSSGQLLSTTSVVRIGYFKDFSNLVTETALRTALSSSVQSVVYQAISNSFVPLGEGLDADLGPASTASVGDRVVNGVTASNRLKGAVANVVPNANAANSFDSANITGVPAGSRLFLLVYNGPVASATELGIFSSDASTWQMVSNNLSNVTLNTTTVDTAAEVFRGSLGSLHLAGFTNVPEPTTLGVLALGSLLTFKRRRR